MPCTQLPLHTRSSSQGITPGGVKGDALRRAAGRNTSRIGNLKVDSCRKQPKHSAEFRALQTLVRQRAGLGYEGTVVEKKCSWQARLANHGACGTHTHLVEQTAPLSAASKLQQRSSRSLDTRLTPNRQKVSSLC